MQIFLIKVNPLSFFVISKWQSSVFIVLKNKIRDLFKVKLFTIRSETKKKRKEGEREKRERAKRQREKRERETNIC